MAGVQINCPNCKGIAIKDGNKIICENCDSSFEIKRTGGAKVVDVGRLDTLEQRVDHHGELLSRLSPEPDPAKIEPDPAENEPDPAKKEVDLLG